jgi:long-chain acyl-CoA synthetase
MTIQSGSLTYAANPADLPRGTLVQLFFETIDRFQKEDALQAYVEGAWRSLSHRKIEERVRQIALALPVLGLERGDRIGLLSENRPEWALADYGVLCFGGLDVPIYATLPPDQISFILRDAGARAIFVSTAEQLAKVLEIRSELPALSKIIVFDEVAVEDPGILTLSQLLQLGAREEEAGRGAGFRERALSAKPDDLATIIYTSGTTGQPKGVMLTHDNIYSNTRAVETVLPVGVDDVALSFLPLSHIFERMVDYFLFSRGLTIAYVAVLDRVVQSMTEVRPTIVVSTPRVYEKLYAAVLSTTGFRRRLVFWARAVGARWGEARLAGEEPSRWVRLQHKVADLLVYRKIRARIGGRLRFFVSGAAPLDPAIARFFYSAGIIILEGYGLTETSPVTNVNTPEELRFGTVGRPVPGTEIMIAEDGEILVRGPQVMRGYFQNPQATQEAIDAEGWFHTGDIGVLEGEGFLRITDRKKDLIVTAGGKNIAPQPIENAIKRSRYVAEAVVLGDRHPYPIVLIVPDFEQLTRWAGAAGVSYGDRHDLVHDSRVLKLLEDEVFRRVEDFARYEKPKRIALLAEEFSIEQGELTPTLKVRRRVVEDHYRKVIDDLYAGAEQVLAE